MNYELTDSPDFKADYENLELDDRSSWKDARASYRRLVHLWHPDKYAQRPREQVHAQQQFIALTKSYDTLRNYQRSNGRLPFEPEKPKSRLKSARTRGRNDAEPHDTPAPESPDSVSSGVLGREPSQRTNQTALKKQHSKIGWIAAGFILLASTLVVFFVLDRSANLKTLERGRAVVRDAPPSEFMPTPAEIRRSEAKGAFVQPTK